MNTDPDGAPAPEVLRTRVEAACALPPLQPEKDALLRLADDYARSRLLAARPLTVALVGATGAGKSTLLNALIGATLAREGVDRPTSQQAVAYAPEGVDLGGLEAAVGRVVRYPVRPEGAWTGQVFVDTPDLNSLVEEHGARAAGVLEQADVAVVVQHRGSVAEARIAEALRPFARRRALVHVINFADQLGAEARAALRGQTARLAAQVLGAEDVPVFVVSALRARERIPAQDDWGALVAALRAMAESAVAAEVRTRNAGAGLAAIRARVATGLARTDAARAEVTAALAAGLQGVRSALASEFSERLDGASGHLAQSVRREAAARLRGPAGWGLRLSGWGSGGLAGAALLSRASLPAGLAAAAGGALLSELRSVTRARAVKRRVLAGGDADALSTLARTALTGARAAASRQGFTPDALGLPEPAEWLEALAEARAAAWREVEDGAVAAAVARWWRWARLLLVPVVQLPLLALFGDVAWRVARAYVSGPPLPAAYYLNAAALGVVLAGAGTVLAGLSLAGATRRIRRAGEACFAQALGGLEERAREDLEEALRPAREAAAALTR